MARYIVSYRISRYWGRIVAYLYRDNCPSNEVDIQHNSQSPSASMPSMSSATSTKGVSCSVAGAGKVTLIGSNCPASRVGRCVDCEGGCTAQVFSDCAILNIWAVRPPAGRQTMLLFCGQYSQKPCWITLDFKEHRPPARQRSPRWSPTTVASPDGQYPGTCSGDSVDRQNDGVPVLCACALLPAWLRWSTFGSDRIVSYRVPYGCIVPSLHNCHFVLCKLTLPWL